MNGRLPKWAVAVAFGFAFAYAVGLWVRRDVNRIGRAIERLRVTLEKRADESEVLALKKAHEIAAAFVENPSFSFRQPLLEGATRSELALLIHHGRAIADQIRVRIPDRRITLAPDRRSARCNLVLEITYSVNEKKDREITELVVDWIKDEENQWRILSISSPEIIKIPASWKEL